MTPTPAAFPYPGSWAIFEGAAVTLAARILSTEDDDGTVAISVAGVEGASGNQRVPMSTLQDPTPLTQAEAAELDRLETSLIGKDPGRPTRASRRADALRDRRIRAAMLRDLLAKIPARAFPAVAAARRQLEAAA